MTSQPLSDSQILVPTGMHRSGTSLLAYWLHHCELHLGTNFGDGTLDNPMGNYEDQDFVKLHNRILRSNSVNHLVTSATTLTIPERFDSDARQIIDARRDIPQWGWKDPRTCLFLDWWKGFLPNMKVIAIYRDYAGVVDSMIRRGRRRYKLRQKNMSKLTTPRGLLKHSYVNVPVIKFYLEVWHRYNSTLLGFGERYPESIIVIDSDTMINRSAQIVTFLNQQWGFNLQPFDIEQLTRRSRLTRSEPVWKSMLATYLLGDAVDVYHRLEALKIRFEERLQ